MLLCRLRQYALFVKKMGHINFYIKTLIIIWCWSGLTVTGTYANGGLNTETSAGIRKAYEQFAGLPQLRNATVSLTVLDVHTGKPVFMANEHVGLTPASTLKNITAATAFHLLGSDFRFRTELAYLGTIDINGVLHGDLVVSGMGDPSLGSTRFEETRPDRILQQWTKALREAGIHSIEGRILVDDLLFGGYRAPGGWPWHDMGNYYGAGISAVNWMENIFGVSLRPGSAVGEPTGIRELSTDISYVKLINEVCTGAPGTGDEVYGFSAPYSERIFLRGHYGIDLQKEILLSLPDPAYQLVYDLKNYLDGEGIQHRGTIDTYYRLQSEGNAPAYLNEGLTMLTVHESPTLGELVYWFNQKSINLYGEALLLAIALRLDPDNSQGSWTDSRKAARLMRDFWVRKIDLLPSALRMSDGSGLSPDNRTTTYAQARILASCQNESWFGPFHRSLPTNNGITMKSGTIGGVLGYAGFHTNTKGEDFVFSVLVNNYDGPARAMRANIFRLLDALKSWPGRKEQRSKTNRIKIKRQKDKLA